MNVYKSSFLLAASTAVRMLLALYTVKITAVALGLSGTGVIGQFNNLLLISTMIAGGGIASGILNVAAKPDQSTHEVLERLRSAHGYGLLFSGGVLLVVVIAHEPLARLLLPIEQGAELLIALAVGQFVLFHISALTSLLNSRQRQDLFAKSSLMAGVVGAAAVTIGCLQFGLTGTLAGILIGALSQWLFLFIGARRAIPEFVTLGRPRLVAGDFRFWWHFTALSLVTIVGMPSAQIAVRNALAGAAGWDTVGTWQAMVRLSDAYLQFGLLFLSSFYFPRLAAAGSVETASLLILRYARWIVPVMLGACLSIYLCRFWIVPLLFSSKFTGVPELFLPQLIGDAFKIASYLFSYAFLTTGHYKLSMAAELIQALLFWLLATQLGLRHEALGVAWSYAATYSLYFLIVLTTFGWILRQSRRNVPPHPSASAP